MFVLEPWQAIMVVMALPFVMILLMKLSKAMSAKNRTHKEWMQLSPHYRTQYYDAVRRYGMTPRDDDEIVSFS